MDPIGAEAGALASPEPDEAVDHHLQTLERRHLGQGEVHAITLHPRLPVAITTTGGGPTRGSV